MTPDTQPEKQNGKLAQALADIRELWNWLALATVWGALLTGFYAMLAVEAYQRGVPTSHTITYSVLAAVLGPAMPIGIFISFRPKRRKP